MVNPGYSDRVLIASKVLIRLCKYSLQGGVFIILNHAYQVFNLAKTYYPKKNQLGFIFFKTLAITSTLSKVSVVPVGKYRP